jgi:hypothetical protein
MALIKFYYNLYHPFDTSELESYDRWFAKLLPKTPRSDIHVGRKHRMGNYTLSQRLRCHCEFH